MTRQEHLDWCKQRAMMYVEAGDYKNAIYSMTSDIGKHPEMGAFSCYFATQLGMLELLDGPTREGVTRYIQGFN